jgi:hypothetical protein
MKYEETRPSVHFEERIRIEVDDVESQDIAPILFAQQALFEKAQLALGQFKAQLSGPSVEEMFRAKLESQQRNLLPRGE